MRSIRIALGIVVASAMGGSAALAATGPLWTAQFGTAAFDEANGVAADASGEYVAGDTDGALTGQVSVGGRDAFLAKYDADGHRLWTDQYGSSADDLGVGVAADATGIYASGWTFGALPGQTNLGRFDTYVRRYDGSGTRLWTTQFGTPSSDVALAIAVHASGLYVLGRTRGVFPGQHNQGGLDFYLAKLDRGGNLIWVREFGSTADDPPFGFGGSVTVDDSGVFVVSTVAGALDGDPGLGREDGFVRKYDFDGNEVWTRLIATPCDDGATVGASSGDGVFVAGESLGNLDDASGLPCSASVHAAGLPPSATGLAFVRRYDDTGRLIWSTSVRPRSGFLNPEAMTASSTTVYVGGEVFRGVDQPAAGPDDPACPRRSWFQDSDAYVAALTVAGRTEWSAQFGTNGLDVPSGLAVNGAGLYTDGSTECALPAQTSAGDYDAFLAKLSP